MTVRKIRILPAKTRIVFAESQKAARLVNEGRAEYVDAVPVEPQRTQKKVKRGGD